MCGGCYASGSCIIIQAALICLWDRASRSRPSRCSLRFKRTGTRFHRTSGSRHNRSWAVYIMNTGWKRKLRDEVRCFADHYLFTRNPAAADRYIRELTERCQVYAQSPFIG